MDEAIVKVDHKSDISPHKKKIQETNGIKQEEDAKVWSVLIVGAGPAGLMLASNLARFGIDFMIIDDRAEKTLKGRADGLQPKTIETFRQLRLAGELLKKGVKIYEISFWNSTKNTSLSRTSRQIHYPEIVDTLDPYVLLLHQGMIEDVFLEDLKSRGIEVSRGSKFVNCSDRDAENVITSELVDGLTGEKKPPVQSNFVIGCDGAHSNVRKCTSLEDWVGSRSDSAWGVIDGVLETNFPDLWTKAVVYSEVNGSMLFIPRERNMTRVYVELQTPVGSARRSETVSLDAIQTKAQSILLPYSIRWTTVEWFSMYSVGQRVASSFASPPQGIYIVGDAAHTHSPKAAQGMNVSMHDSFNLAWKLSLVLREIALPALIETYETERKEIADRLIEFDYEHAKAFLAGDPEALAQNFYDNIRFISGTGASYAPNVLNEAVTDFQDMRMLNSGSLLPIARVTRFIDSNPIDIQLDIPMLGQFRIYFVVHEFQAAHNFFEEMSAFLMSSKSALWQASQIAEKSYALQPVRKSEEDDYILPGRYNSVSRLFTPAIMTTTHREDVEINDLPYMFQLSPWTFYIDDQDNEKEVEVGSCTDKWFGRLEKDRIAIVNVRPDGYVGSASSFSLGHHTRATEWLNHYYSQFLNV